jgi:nicotinate-nucleotide adenylyltransferase
VGDPPAPADRPEPTDDAPGAGYAARIGWLGGSFAPVHEGHLSIATLAAERFGLERVLLVPAARPPHKLGVRQAPAEDRLRWVEQAVADDPRLEACDIELRRDGPSYSVVTARELRERFGPDAQLHYIIGADTLADLPNWYRIEELCELVTFCAVTRPGTPLDAGPMEAVVGSDAAAHIVEHLLEVDPHPASSTAIREALGRGEAPQHLPAVIVEDVLASGVYGAGGASSSDVSGGSADRP